MSAEKRIYGIDLGTTYSTIAYVNEFNQAEIIANSDNERVTPSVVFFESPTNIIVGRVAKESAKTDPDSVVDFVKRQMGTDYTFHYQGVDYKPEELSSYIVRRLAEDAKKTGEHEVADVVITCPAYFGEAERNATRLAGVQHDGCLLTDSQVDAYSAKRVDEFGNKNYFYAYDKTAYPASATRIITPNPSLEPGA